MKGPVHVLISIDVEPDGRLLERNGGTAWQGTEYLFSRIAEIRDRLARHSTGPVRFGWYWRPDPQIEQVHGDAGWPLHAFAGTIGSCREAGDGFGIHPHGWRWDGRRKIWFTDHGDPSWISRCVRQSFETFARHMGEPRLAFRFGDGWINEETLALAESLGARYDLTVEPGSNPGRPRAPVWEIKTGEEPDLTDVPALPYRPATGDFRRPDPESGRTITVYPVSTAFSPANAPNRVRTTVDAVARHAMLGRVGRAVECSSLLRKGIHEAGRACLAALGCPMPTGIAVLNLAAPASCYARVLETALGASDGRYLHTVLRTGDLAQPENRANFAANVAFLADHPSAGRFTFTTPARLEADG